MLVLTLKSEQKVFLTRKGERVGELFVRLDNPKQKVRVCFDVSQDIDVVRENAKVKTQKY